MNLFSLKTNNCAEYAYNISLSTTEMDRKKWQSKLLHIFVSYEHKLRFPIDQTRSKPHEILTATCMLHNIVSSVTTVQCYTHISLNTYSAKNYTYLKIIL